MVKKIIRIFLVLLFLLFQVNTVSAIMLDYLFSSQVEVNSLAVGDPIGMDGGNVEVKFTLDSNTEPDDVSALSGFYRSFYFNVLSEVELQDSIGNVVYYDSVDAEVRVGDSQTVGIDGIGWHGEILIDGNPYRVDAVAVLPVDFVNFYPDFPRPFPFSEDDLVEESHLFIVDLGVDNPRVVYQNSDDTFYAGGNPVPEPTTMLLFGAGLVGLAGFGRKKFKK